MLWRKRVSQADAFCGSYFHINCVNILHENKVQMGGEEKKMGKLELWHVFADDVTGERSCFYGYRDALTFNQEGEFIQMMQGKTEILVEEWNGAELCRVLSGCLKGSGMVRLTDLPEMILRAMEKCGVSEGKREEVLRKVLDEAVSCP